jgi:hypothetical protein
MPEFLREPRQGRRQDLAVARTPHERAGVLAHDRANVALYGIGGDDARQHRQDEQGQHHRGGGGAQQRGQLVFRSRSHVNDQGRGGGPS